MATDVATAVKARRFTADDYHRMTEAGILHEDDRVELIDGEIMQMSPIGGRHLWAVTRLDDTLRGSLGDKAIILVQNPIHIDDYGEPEPDIATIRQRDYGNELPTPEDVLITIEVADTSLSYESNTKLPLYASAGIPEAFLVDLNGQTIERRSDPANGRYRSVRIAGLGESIESTVFPELILKVNDILGI